MTAEQTVKLKAAYKANPGIGRVSLAKVAGVSEQNARTFLENSKKTAYESMPSPEPASEVKASAISLKDARVSDNRPQQDQVKRRLCNLKRGVAYPVDALAEEWGVSDESLRKNARKMECLKYVEVKPFDWVLCVMNPDTAEQYNKQRK